MPLLLALGVASGARALAGDSPSRLPSRHSEPVVLQLLWRHGFQFAGYYMARAKGYYREAGFEVEFRERTMELDALTEVLEGRAAYGVGSCRIVNDYVRGAPVVVLAAVFQHSPRVIVTSGQSRIVKLADLVGKRVAVPNVDCGPDIARMLAREGVRPEEYVAVPHEQSVDALVQGRVDAQVGYVTYEPYELRRRGVPHQVFLPRDYGLDFYGDCLYTTRERARHEPERAWAFREASLRGWQYALEHVDETVAHILAAVQPDGDRERLLYEAVVIRDLIDPDLVALGHMNARRWKDAWHGLSDSGLRGDELEAKLRTEFLFDTASADPAHRRVRVLLLVLGLTGGAALALLAAVCTLRVLVDRRTKALAGANAALTTELQARCDAEAFLERQRDVAMELARSQSPEACADAILALILGLPDVDCGGFYFLREVPRELTLVAHGGLASAFTERYARLAADSCYWEGVMTGNALPYDHAALRRMADPHTLEEGLTAVMTVPVCFEGRVEGSLHVASHRATAFTPTVQAALETVAMQVAGSVARLRATDALRESEANFRRVTECAFDAVVVIDPTTGRPIYANPGAFALLKYAPADMPRLVFSDMVPPAYLALSKERLRARLLGQEVPDHYELELRRSDGVDIPVDVGVRMTEWQGQRAVLYAFRDISERKRLEQEVVAVSEWEKKRIGRDLHDSLGQQLTGMGLLLDAFAVALESVAPQCVPPLRRIRECCTKAHGEVRQIVRGLVPAAEGEGLASCLARLAADLSNRMGIACTFQGTANDVVLSTASVSHLYHIAQEAASNAVRHGGARRVTFVLVDEAGFRTLRIEDDGRGFDPAERLNHGSGLRIMRDRADLAGGALTVERRSEGGMRVECRLGAKPAPGSSTQEAVHGSAQL